MRQGFSLTELVLVLAVGGLLFGIALPRLSAALDHIEVESAATHLVAAHQRARIMAVTGGQVLVLTIDTANVVIRRLREASPLWAERGPAATRVALEGPPRQFTFSPVGLTLGFSNATLRLTRGSATRTIVISRLGRVRIIH
jgi:prepilin-type N-terminal cleavage/methylation domain-containing protein